MTKKETMQKVMELAREAGYEIRAHSGLMGGQCLAIDAGQSVFRCLADLMYQAAMLDEMIRDSRESYTRALSSALRGAKIDSTVLYFEQIPYEDFK